MTVKCELCKNFRVGYSPSDKNLCARTGKSALWERAVKPSTTKHREGGGPNIEIMPIYDNCGYVGQFFEEK